MNTRNERGRVYSLLGTGKRTGFRLKVVWDSDNGGQGVGYALGEEERAEAAHNRGPPCVFPCPFRASLRAPQKRMVSWKVSVEGPLPFRAREEGSCFSKQATWDSDNGG